MEEDAARVHGYNGALLANVQVYTYGRTSRGAGWRGRTSEGH
jgi:hypothetical protein